MGLPLPTTQPKHQQPAEEHVLDKLLFHGQGQGQGSKQGLGQGQGSAGGSGRRQGNPLILEHIDTIASVARRHSTAEAMMYAHTDTQVIQILWGKQHSG